MPITSDNPTVVPAAAEKTFDQWWLSGLHIHANDCNAPVNVNAAFRKMTQRDAETGLAELDGGMRGYHVPDLFALASENPDVAALIDTLVTTVGALAKAANVID